MTTNNIDGFFQAAQADAALLQELKGASSEQEFFQTAARRGAERGFSFNADEVRTAMSAKPVGELSEAALSAVAGGQMQTVTSWMFCTHHWLGC